MEQQFSATIYFDDDTSIILLITSESIWDADKDVMGLVEEKLNKVYSYSVVPHTSQINTVNAKKETNSIDFSKL